ncbi:hypothetical protein PQR52_01575 [Paraburkholderia aspalathi]|uniref:hypothetical protein n=1 Tax=Paraburkholderia aspalathi TaxID=1324617 RepID=UPI0038B8E3A5
MLKDAQGDSSAKARRVDIRNELAVATQDLSDTRVAIEAAVPLVKEQRAKESIARVHAVTERVRAELEQRPPLAEKIDEMIGDLATQIVALEAHYTKAQHAAMAAMDQMNAMAIGWDHEQVAQSVIGRLLRLCNWDLSVITNLSSNGLSLLPQSHPIACLVTEQNARLLSVRQREEDRIERAITVAMAPPEPDEPQTGEPCLQWEIRA